MTAFQRRKMAPSQGIAAFLDDLALAGAGSADDDSFDHFKGQDPDRAVGPGRVSLMTLHASKGLEFPTVFIAGMVRMITPFTVNPVTNRILDLLTTANHQKPI